MTDKSPLLHQLRLDDRHLDWPEPGSSSRRLWLLAAAIAVAGGAAATLYHYRDAPAVTRVNSVAVQSSGSRPSGSVVLQASGYIVARRQATLSAKITGRLAAVIVEEGQRVERGQILARLDDTNAAAALGVAEANLNAAQLAFRDARPIYERSRKILGQGISTQQAFDAATAAYHMAESNLAVAQSALAVARRNMDDTVITAPFSGVITDKAANEGEIVSPISAGGGFTRTGICTLVDMDSLEVDVDVSEDFIKHIHEHHRATATLDAYPNETFAAHVIAIVPTADRSKGTIKVRVGFDTRNSHILPELSAHVNFLGVGAQAGGSEVTVPAAVIVRDANGSAAFVIAGDHVERRNVILGATRGGTVVIRSGLTAGELVAAGDLTALTDGEKVQVGN